METGALTPRRYRRWDVAVLILACVGFTLFITARAWVAEDAYITFRVIDNFFQGYGLRWNIAERVQAYTHPLWMFLHMPLYGVLPNLFLDTIILSVSCTMLAIALTLYSVRGPVLIALSCFLLPLFYSKSFIDYTTSGMENPLSYLLFAVFGHIVLNKYEHKRFWLYASLTAALAMLNRLDMVFLYAPALAYAAYFQRGRIRWGQVIAGFAPLMAWLCFSLFYYGFLFPNTKYAKLDSGLTLAQYIEQGFHYSLYLFFKDTPGMLILFAPLMVFALPKRFAVFRLAPALAAGIYLSCAYVVYIGGDYMAGRFWALPVFCSAWLFYACCPRVVRVDILFALGCLLMTAYIAPYQFEAIRRNCTSCIPLIGRVMDARVTFAGNRLFITYNPLRARTEGQYKFAEKGKALAQAVPPPVLKSYFIGMSGFYAGPKVHMIDELALADPLLARLPVPQKQVFYIGHFRRKLPQGYLKALQKHSLRPMKHELAQYYEKLQLIVSGELFDPERLKTIALFNLGYYDHWKYEYLSKHPQ